MSPTQQASLRWMQIAGVASSLQPPEASAPCVVVWHLAARRCTAMAARRVAAGLRLPRPAAARRDAAPLAAAVAAAARQEGLLHPLAICGGTGTWGARWGLGGSKEDKVRVEVGSEVRVGLWWAKFTYRPSKCIISGWVLRISGISGTGV